MQRLSFIVMAGPYLTLAGLAGLAIGRETTIETGMLSVVAIAGAAFLIHGLVMAVISRRRTRGQPALDVAALARFNTRLDAMERRLAELAAAPQPAVTAPALQAAPPPVAARTPIEPPPLAAIAPRSALERIKQALVEGDIGIALQPIVGLPRGATLGFEATGRLGEGLPSPHGAGGLAAAAEAAGVRGALDRLLIRRALSIALRLRVEHPGLLVFCDVAPASLTDETCLGEVRRRAGAPVGAGLVLQLALSEFETLRAPQAALTAWMDLGVQFCLRAPLAAPSREALSRVHPAFVRINAAALAGGPGGQPAVAWRGVLEQARMAGAEVVLDDVTSPIDAQRGAQHAAYGQGQLFGAPRAVSAAALAEADSYSGVMRPGRRA